MKYTSALSVRARTVVPKELENKLGEINSIKFDGLTAIINKGGYKVTEKSRRRIHLPLGVVNTLNAVTGDFIVWELSNGTLTVSVSKRSIDAPPVVSKSIDWDKAEILIIHSCRYGHFTGNKHKEKKELPKTCQSNLCVNYACWYGTCKKSGDKCTACKIK